MSRYIDVEELKHITNNSKYYDTQELRDFLDMVYETPTADVISIVRCKDCKWFGYNECLDPRGLVWALDDHYCSCGERR